MLFILSVLAIVPLAALLSHATESVAAKTGDAAGGLLNATLAKAVPKANSMSPYCLSLRPRLRITRNWRGKPLETLEVVVESIGATTTETGLDVHAWLDEGAYEKGRKVSDRELAECHLKRHAYHGEWNYEIHRSIPAVDTNMR